MEEHVDATDSKQKTPANAPPTIPPLAKSSPAALTHATEGDEEPEKISKSDKIMLIATGFIALGTLVSAGAICFQWREMVRGSRDTTTIAQAAQQQVCAARSFASSADKINTDIGNAVTKLGQQADDAETFFRTDERAWVVINSIEKTQTIPPEPPFGTIFKFSIFPKNVGKTVARDVRIHAEKPDASGSFMEDQRAILMSQDQLFHISGTNKRAVMPDNPGPQTLAPGAQSPVSIFSGGQEPKRYGDGNFRYSFILGRIEYTDAFASGTGHTFAISSQIPRANWIIASTETIRTATRKRCQPDQSRTLPRFGEKVQG